LTYRLPSRPIGEIMGHAPPSTAVVILICADINGAASSLAVVEKTGIADFRLRLGPFGSLVFAMFTKA
jgi:hypothetical protein